MSGPSHMHRRQVVASGSLWRPTALDNATGMAGAGQQKELASGDVRLLRRKRAGVMPQWYSADEYVHVERVTRRRVQLRRLLEPQLPPNWLVRGAVDLPAASWPPPHQLLASRRAAVSTDVLAALDSCAAECTARRGWAPHDRLGYEFGALNMGVLGLSAIEEVEAAVECLALETWGAEFATANRSCFRQVGACFLLRYGDGSRPPPPHYDVKALRCGAQTANAILYLSGDGSGATGGQTVLLSVPPDLADDTEITPERGKLAIWRSYTDDGVLDPRARHTTRTLTGTKMLLTISLRRGV